MSLSDDNGLQKTHVTIYGAEYTLRSQTSEQYTHKISEFVDQKMKEIANTENLGDTTRVALMAAFDIADQLLRERTQHRADRIRTAEAVRHLEQHLDGVHKDDEAA